MKYHNLPTALAAAGMLASLGSAQAATTLSTHSRGMGSNTFVGLTNLVGRGGTSVTNATVVVFSVSQILADIQVEIPTFTVGDLATSDFALSFDTTAAVKILPDGATYTVNYLGFTANADVVPNTFWNSSYTPLTHWNPTTSPSTGVEDTLALQTGITSTPFQLTGITESDTNNDYVVFGIGYSALGPTSNVRDTPGNINLTLIPEPSATLLGSLGLLALLRRRRA